jgi:hypothetical protein
VTQGGDKDIGTAGGLENGHTFFCLHFPAIDVQSNITHQASLSIALLVTPVDDIVICVHP